jgi:hypothetical protein
VSAFNNSSHLAVSSMVYVFVSEISRPNNSPYLDPRQPANIPRDIQMSELQVWKHAVRLGWLPSHLEFHIFHGDFQKSDLQMRQLHIATSADRLCVTLVPAWKS